MNKNFKFNLEDLTEVLEISSANKNEIHIRDKFNHGIRISYPDCLRESITDDKLFREILGAISKRRLILPGSWLKKFDVDMNENLFWIKDKENIF